MYVTVACYSYNYSKYVTAVRALDGSASQAEKLSHLPSFIETQSSFQGDVCKMSSKVIAVSDSVRSL